MPKKYILTAAPPAPRKSTVLYEKELNPDQLEVVQNAEGPCLVLAGAGSGKTRTLVYRMLYLLERGVAPQNIILVTFTNKAASEMRNRIEKALGRTQGLWCGTFHHVGHRLLRIHAEKAGYTDTFGILDEEDAVDLLKTCYTVLRFKPQEVHFPRATVVRSILSLTANMGTPLGEVIEEHYPYFSHFEKEIALVAAEYETRKKKTNNLDYDDLLTQWLKLMRECPEIGERVTRQFRYCLVDEYQDTSRLQNEVMIAVSARFRNLLAVGDDAQSIYSFRGARIQNILDFPRIFPDTKIYRLETNYRSTPSILNLANRSIEHNRNQFHKELRGVRPDGPMPQLVRVRDPREQALFAAQRVLEFVDEGVELHEIAVLFRARYQAAELELELAKRKIPYVLRGGVRFFEQAHIKDVLAYLKIIHNPADEIAWMRSLMLHPGIGLSYANQIFQSFAQKGAALELIRKDAFFESFPARVRNGLGSFRKTLGPLIDPKISQRPDLMIEKILKSGYAQYLETRFENARDRLEDLEELMHFAHTYKHLAAFLNDVLLRESFKGETIGAEEREERSHLVLTTVHQAKGLEWKVVMIIGLSEGQFPHHSAEHSEPAMEEERRLFYVAVTRTRDEIFLIHPMTRYDYHMGAVVTRSSPFIEELPSNTWESLEIERSEEITLEPTADAIDDEVVADDP